MMRKYVVLATLSILALLMAACQPQTVVVKETVVVTEKEIVKETVVVEETVEVEVTKILEKPVEIEKVVTATPLPAAAFHESAVLKGQVDRGQLPPLDERLPVNPMVLEPLVEQGQYGGTLRFGFVGQSATWGGLLYIAGWDHIVNWAPSYNEVIPNAIAGWDVSDDATEYTFYMRKGMKWSDGEPYTSEDIRFYIEDVLGNEELSPGGIGGDWITPELAEGFKMEVIDDYTFKFIFPKPHGTFLYNLAIWSGRYFTQHPAHYLKQFHADYNPDVQALVDADDMAEDWTALFWTKAPGTWGDPQWFFDYPELPTLAPWRVVQPLGTGTTVILERNPYYWKVDTEGNQLPYIDQIVATSYQNNESMVFAMLNGDLDWIANVTLEQRPLFYEAVDAGKPLVIKHPQSDCGNTQSLMFNLSTPDPVLSEVFSNKDFRIGVSYAIDRAEIIEVVQNGEGEPVQVCPLESSPLYNEQLCTQYIEYDLDLANEYLDKVLPNKDAEGWRLGPDGEPFEPIISVVNDFSYGGDYVQRAEMVVAYMRDVGINVQLNAVADAVFRSPEGDYDTNRFQIYSYHGCEGAAGLTAILDPRWHVPGEYWGAFAWGWRLWWLDTVGDNEYKVEPPAYAEEVRNMYLEAVQMPTVDQQIEAMREIMQRSADIFWHIGVTRPGSSYQPVSDRLGNIPETWWAGWLPGGAKIIFPEQWYIK